MLPLSSDLAALLLAESSDLISLHDPDGTFRWASPAARAVLGYEPAALVGQSGLHFVHPDDVGLVQEVLAGLLTDPAGAPQRLLTYRAVRADGAIVWLEGHCRTLRAGGATGAPAQHIVVTRDVTARVAAEQQAAADRALREQLFEEGLAGETVLQAIRDPRTGAITDFNFVRRNRRARQAARQQGDAVEAVGPGTPTMLARFPASATTTFPRYCAVLVSGQPWEDEQEFHTPAGETTSVTRMLPLPDDQLSVSWLDLTPARHLETRLTEERRVFEAVFNSVAAGLTIFQAERDATGTVCDFRIRRRNPRALVILNIAGTDEGALMSARYPLMMTNGLFGFFVETLRTGQPWHDEVRYDEAHISGSFDVFATRLDADRLCVSFTDQTPVRRAEAALAESRSQLALAAEVAGLGLTEHEIGIDEMTVSPEYVRMLGLPTGTARIALTQLTALFGADEIQTVFLPYQQAVLRGEHPAPIRLHGRRADTGQPVVLLTMARLAAGERPCMQSVSLDISGLIAAEQAATEAQAQLTLAADAAGLGLSVRNLASTELLINPAMARLYGLPPGTTTTRLETLLALTHPDDRRRSRPAFEAALRKAGNTSQTQFRIRQADTGHERTLLSAARAEAGPDGVVRRILSVTLDVSELARARAVTEQLDYWQALTDGLPEIMWVADAAAAVTQRLNQRWFAYTGHSPDVLLDQSWVQAVHPTDLADPETNRRMQAGIRAGQSYEVKFRLRRHDGAWRWFLARAAPLRDTAGHVVNWVGLTVDVHERELAEVHLRRAIADLDTFVYVAAHDLKSPIDNLEGIISGLRDESDDRRRLSPPDAADRAQDVLLDHASQSIARFRATLADMAQVVAAQAPDDALARPLDLTTLVSDLVLDMQAEFAAADGVLCLDLRVPTLGGLPARHLRSVLFNLITNSLKYRAPGRPARLWLRTRPGQGGHVVLSLSDNGLGLDPASAARAFELFGRLHPGAAGGTGIGLFIVRRIIEQAGGETRIRGRVGEGTTFSLYLPDGAGSGHFGRK